jgi:putative transcriptional regulator
VKNTTIIYEKLFISNNLLELLNLKVVFLECRVKELRLKNGLSQRQLAEMVGVRRETIVFLEKGKHNPSLKLAFQVSNALNAGIEEVFVFHKKESDDEHKFVGVH